MQQAFIVADLTLSSKDELAQQALEQFTDDLDDLIARHELRTVFDLSATVRLATFDNDGNEVLSGVDQEL